MGKGSLLLIGLKNYVYQLDKLTNKKLIKTRSGTKKPDLFLCKFKIFICITTISQLKLLQSYLFSKNLLL